MSRYSWQDMSRHPERHMSVPVETRDNFQSSTENLVETTIVNFNMLIVITVGTT
jgi:hypothetical protein